MSRKLQQFSDVVSLTFFDGLKINKTCLLIINQKRIRQKAEEDNITTRKTTITINENCRCRKERAKCKVCQK